MDKGVAQMLFSYLRDCIYAPNKAQLDMNALPCELQDFGQGLQFLCYCLQEQKAFSDELLAGNFNAKPPSVENGIAAPLKAMQGRLMHLEWQTKQVAAGDYSQKLDFMGDFSEAFNTMTHQLKERQEALERQNQALRANRELLLGLVLDATRVIVIIDLKSNNTLFLSKSAEQAQERFHLLLPSLYEQMHRHVPDSGQPPVEWEYLIRSSESGAQEDVYLAIKSYFIVWEGVDAAAHVLSDISEARRARLEMQQLAYTDPLTGLMNRSYVMDILKDYLSRHLPFCLAFVDLDGLKECNDNQGHLEGDRYLCAAAEKLKQIPDALVARVGGDEFIVLYQGVREEKLRRHLEDIRGALLKDSGSYLESISYGISVCTGTEPESPEKILSAADEKMYQYKQKYKQARRQQ